MSVVPPPPSFCLRLDSELKTVEFGQLVARTLTRGSILALTGELGAGKTQFTKGVGTGLGVPREHITSPTFTLIQEYMADIPIIHVDLYRLETLAEVQALGLGEYFQQQCVLIIEWAERMESELPPDHLKVHFVHHEDHPNTRILSLLGTGPHSLEMINRVKALLSQDDAHGFSLISP